MFFKSHSASVRDQEQLVSNIKSTIAEAEDVLQATTDQVSDKFTSLRARVQDRLQTARERLVDAEAALIDTTRAAARAADDYVHESPWVVIGAATAVGLLVGVLIGRSEPPSGAQQLLNRLRRHAGR